MCCPSGPHREADSPTCAAASRSGRRRAVSSSERSRRQRATWTWWPDNSTGGTGSGPVRYEATATEARVTFDAVNNYSGGGTASFQFRFQIT